MLRRAVIWALVAIPLAAGSAVAAGFAGSSANPGNSFTAANRFCELDPTVTVGASADTYVNSGSGSSNHGGSAELEIGPVGLLFLTDRHQGLVRFHMPAVPSHCTLTGATLRLYNRNASGGRTIQVYRAASAWGENTATWNNRPATTGSAVTDSAGNGWQSWNVLGQVQSQYGGSNHGFLVKDSNDTVLLSALQRYQSREGTPDTQDPQLVLSFGS